jgi:hypothetical protein
MSFKMQGEIKTLQQKVAALEHALALIGGKPEYDPSELFAVVRELEERIKKQDLRYNALNARVSKKEKQ